MISRYPLLKMEEFLRLRKDFFEVDDSVEYQLVTVQLHARGIRERSKLMGSEIKTKKQQRVRGGDLLVAEIDAKVGGYGIVPQGLDGSIVSGHYFLYEIDRKIIESEFLEYYLQSGYPEQEIQKFVKGSVNYAAIRSQHFPQLEIPLPPLEKQKRVIQIMRKVNEMRGFQAKILDEIDGLLLSTFSNSIWENE